MRHSKLLIPELHARRPAGEAVMQIFQHLCHTLSACEQALLISDDREALHDFRVAVRRTRCGLSQFKNLLPPPYSERFRRYFKWLGEISSEMRDLDVYLESFPDYQACLPVAQRDALQPLYALLQNRQQQARKQLMTQLHSAEHRAGFEAWKQWLQTAEPQFNQDTALQPARKFASRCIFKNYRKVLKLGRHLTLQSPDDSWHELRKRCKKLRYLLEFFQAFYPDKQITRLIKHLKHFQDVLGGYQDLAVQTQALRQWQQEIQTEAASATTQTALDRLIFHFEQQKQALHQQFTERFAEFACSEQQAEFKALFSKA